MIVDDRYGRDVLDAETGRGSWIARPIELPEQTPLAFEGGADVGMTLREWPVDQVVKVLVRYRADDPEPARSVQEQRLITLFEACRLTEHEILIELIANDATDPHSDAVAAGMERFYALGIRTDWWKLMAPGDAKGWTKIADTIANNDPFCRGVLLLGLDAPEDDLVPSIAAAARQEVCKGFAIGRTIFGEVAEVLGLNAPDDELARGFADAARGSSCRGFAVGRTIFGDASEAWLSGRLDDAAVVAEIGRRYARLIAAWRSARKAVGS